MAIYINTGATGGSKNPAAKRSPKSNQVKQQPGMVSSTEGTTAVQKKGILGAIGNLAKKALPIAASFIPGVGGIVAKTLDGVVNGSANDPEWWQSVPGESVTMNVPLRPYTYDAGEITIDDIADNADAVTWNTMSKLLNPTHVRPYQLEFISISSFALYDPLKFFNVTENMATQYLMTEIRKVVNAVPLQAASTYREVLANNAVAYSLWRQLKKYKFLITHGQTYLPNFDDPMYEVLQTANAAWLDSRISRLEEFLHASVRLPHTLCEYLAWRFGRIYRINKSAKAAIVMHNVIGVQQQVATYDEFISDIIAFNTTTTARQQAATDIMNAYINHDMFVDVPDDTQFIYDAKEFALRCNMNVALTGVLTEDTNINPIMIDSDLDNPTVFMASSVSTGVYNYDSTTKLPLFPVVAAKAHIRTNNGDAPVYFYSFYTVEDDTHAILHIDDSNYGTLIDTINGSQFIVCDLSPVIPKGIGLGTYPITLFKLVLCKSLEYYNAGIYTPVSNGAYMDEDLAHSQQSSIKFAFSHMVLLDVTALSEDLGAVTDAVISNEHIYAFANLVNIDRKTSLSKGNAETQVAKMVADTMAGADISQLK